MAREQAAPVGVVGGGIGGLTLAIVLDRLGVAVEVHEQTRAFGRVGAAIQLTPNAVRLLDRLGLGERVRETAWRPPGRIARDHASGEVLARSELGAAAEARFGAPVLTLHRADLLDAIEARVPQGVVRFGHRLVGLDRSPGAVRLRFEDGARTDARVVVGADGIHSVVRRELRGVDEPPHYTGMLAYRSIVPVERLRGEVDRDHLTWFTKWWGPTRDSQLVTFPISAGRELFLFATVPTTGEPPESWSAPGSVDELRAGFAAYHPDARTLLDAVDTTLRTALYDREPLDGWSDGRVTLLGDACHAMTPFMAQGAAQSMEDAVVLGRELAAAGPGDVPAALRAYEAARRARTDTIQRASRENWWLRTKPDPSWVYGWDAWEGRNVVAPLDPTGTPLTSP